MCGCCSRAATLISRSNRSAPCCRDQLGVQHLEGDGSVVPEVVREVDRGHAAPAELALDGITVLEGVFQGRSNGHDNS